MALKPVANNQKSMNLSQVTRTRDKPYRSAPLLLRLSSLNLLTIVSFMSWTQ
jgi:hypothetical protein